MAAIPVAGQLGALEGRRILGVGHALGEGGKGRELAAAALAGGHGDLLIDVIGEELKRSQLAVLLAHEELRRERGEQGAEGSQRAGHGRQTIAEGPVADLVVVLGEDDEPVDGNVVGRSPEAPSAKGGEVAVVDMGAVKGLGQLSHASRNRRSSRRARQ